MELITLWMKIGLPE